MNPRDGVPDYSINEDGSGNKTITIFSRDPGIDLRLHSSPFFCFRPKAAFKHLHRLAHGLDRPSARALAP